MSTRHRFATHCALSAAALLTLPAFAAAAAPGSHGLTIATAENPIPSGQTVVIYGRMKGPDNVGRTVLLYHHLDGTHSHFSLAGETKTTIGGYYEFPRADGLVTSNREWFALAPGRSPQTSRTMYESVSALVSISRTSATGTTAAAVTFIGQVSPNRSGRRVVLQQQATGDRWTYLTATTLDSRSTYAISYRWKAPGLYAVRLAFGHDQRNLGAESDTIPVAIQPAQNPWFTIGTSSPVTAPGRPATIGGTLFVNNSATPQPSSEVELCRGADSCEPSATTAANGSYSFAVASNANQVYLARTRGGPTRSTADLFVGVEDAISAAVSGPHRVGHVDVFSGVVDGGSSKAGGLVLLQQRGADGFFHGVATGRVKANGAYAISWRYGNPGRTVFRTRILADAQNLGGASRHVGVTVTLPATRTLPPAS